MTADSSSPQLLRGKVAIVTGAASGIGRAMTIAMAEQGAAVTAVDRDRRGLDETLDVAPGNVAAIVGDVSVEADVRRFVLETFDKHGKLTTLCNNAAISIPGTVEELTVDDFRRTLEVNLVSQFLGARYAVPLMRQSGGGSIINTGSGNSVLAEKSLVGYTASKGGVLMLTRALALDHASEGVRVNCLCPGFVDTPINLPHYARLGGIDQVRASLGEWVPMGRAGLPREIADAAVWLASDLSSYVTGAAIAVDGGITAGV